LQRDLEAWLARWGLAGATISLQRPDGEAWTGAAGVHQDGTPFAPGEQFAALSITKTFTVALTLRLAERGLLDLDEPAGAFVSELPEADRFTVRNLIQHTSGLVVGDEDPYDALASAAQAGLQFEPGSSTLYSRAGFYVLGLIIERVTGKSYTQALHEELLDPLGLASTMMDEEIEPLEYSTHPFRADRYGYQGVIWSSGGLHEEILPDVDYRGLLWSSGGLRSTTTDLARWALALWGAGGEVVSAGSREQMTAFREREFDFVGLGTYPFCPCWLDGNRLQAQRWGHFGLTSVIEYDSVDGVGLAIHVSESVADERVVAALDDLSNRMRQMMRGRPILTTTHMRDRVDDGRRNVRDGLHRYSSPGWGGSVA
jgi:CubicO group peptidase (beta-lactamase class C family)